MNKMSFVCYYSTKEYALMVSDGRLVNRHTGEVVYEKNDRIVDFRKRDYLRSFNRLERSFSYDSNSE